MMKVLVTGGAGFIGSHTIVELQNSGYDVVAIDNFENSKPEVLDNIKTITGKSFDFIKADIRSKSDLSDVFTKHPDIKAVIHFAAYKAVGESVAEPIKYYENNIGGTVNILNEMMKRNIMHFVFSSSCTVYGDVPFESLPITESSPTVKANSPYGNTKKVCEEMLMDHAKTGKVNVTALRYFNPIGAHESCLIGELPIGVPGNLVPFITQTAIGKRDKLTVWGNDYPTPDGTAIRDYIHVVDIAKAHVKAINYLESHSPSFYVFNLGTGKGNSVLEAIHSFEKMSGVKLNYVMGPRRPGDVVQIYASCDYASSELGWKTEYTMDDAMLSAWNWELHLKELAGK